MDQTALYGKLSKKIHKLLKKQKILHEEIMKDRSKLIRDAAPTKDFLKEKLRHRTALILSKSTVEKARAPEFGLSQRITKRFTDLLVERQSILRKYRQGCDRYAYAAHGRAEMLVRRCMRRGVTPIQEKNDQGSDPIDTICAATQRLTLGENPTTNPPVCSYFNPRPATKRSRPASPLSQGTPKSPTKRRKHYSTDGHASSRSDASVCRCQVKSVTKESSMQTGRIRSRPGLGRRTGSKK